MENAQQLEAEPQITTRDRARAGFTLIETLAALAITSVIIVSTGVLIHQSVFFFDRGTRTVDKGEELALAIDCLTNDFSAARFVLQKSAKGLSAAFLGLPASEDGNAKVLFISARGKSAGAPIEEVVNLTVETGNGFTQLVRRHAAWSGPRMLLTDAMTSDAVILLKGKYDISFSFSEQIKDGTLIWHDSWTGEKGLPHSIRLNVYDSESGAALFAGAEFFTGANAPVKCIAADIDCLSLAAADAKQTGQLPASSARN